MHIFKFWEGMKNELTYKFTMLPVSAVFLCAHVLITAESSSLELGYFLDMV